MAINRGGAGLVVALVWALAGLAGCSDGPADAAREERNLEEELGLDDDGIRLKQTTAENLIRDCMKEQGFDYVPVDPAAQQAALVGAHGLGKDDFEKQYGYGITTLYEQRRELAVAGPNERYRSSLGEADGQAYDRALHGDDPTATFAHALDTGDYSRLGGCVRAATEEVFGGADVLESLAARLDELDAEMRADARMVKAVKAWSACMREAGFDGLAEQEDVDAVLEAKLEEIVGVPGEASRDDYDRDALAALQTEEVAMVTADIDCEEEHVEEVEEKVAAEYEEAFREENSGLLAKVPPP